jgi:hypothetical protein
MPLATMARVRLEQGRFDEARVLFERALALHPDGPGDPLEVADLQVGLADAVVEMRQRGIEPASDGGTGSIIERARLAAQAALPVWRLRRTQSEVEHLEHALAELSRGG